MGSNMGSSAKEEDRGKVPLQESTTNTELGSHEDAEHERELTVNVFFDGTGNNKYNTESRLEDEEYLERINILRNYENEIAINELNKLEGREPMPLEEEMEIKHEIFKLKEKQSAYQASVFKNLKEKPVSYENEFSNVALLEQVTKEQKGVVLKIYIDGAGTTQNKTDNTIKGLGLATDETGAVARVNEAFKVLTEKVDELAATKIILNVFGFSRGSFYARLFCAMAKYKHIYHPRGYKNHTRYMYHERLALNLGKEDIKINFVGIYDTVSSHGLEHYEDTKTFPIDIGAKQEIKKIVHLTAQNEYRKHFPLTRVNQALKDGCAFECSLPGAHSNLGGGYTDYWEEKNHYLSYFLHFLKQKNVASERRPGEIYWKYWVNKGYYDSNKGEVRKKAPGGGYNEQVYSYVVGSRILRYHYQFIPLLAMKFCMEEYIDNIVFEEDQHRYKERMIEFERQKKEKSEAGTTLKMMSDFVMEFIEKNHSKNGFHKISDIDALKNDRRCKTLYHTYINNSLQPIPKANLFTDVANEGTWENQDKAGNPQRPTVDGG